MKFWKPTSLLDIAKGIVTGDKPLNKFGYNGNVSEIQKDIWPYDTPYNWLDEPTQMYASSSNEEDSSTGIGARTVVLKGLDPNWVELDGLAALDGHSRVPVNGAFIRAFRAKVETAGIARKSIGTIYFHNSEVTAGVPDNPAAVYAIILPVHNKTLMTLWTVPADRILMLAEWRASTSAVQTVEVHLYIRERADEDGVFQLEDLFHIKDGRPWRQPYRLPLDIPGKSDLVVRAHCLKPAGGAVSAGFSGWYGN